MVHHRALVVCPCLYTTRRPDEGVEEGLTGLRLAMVSPSPLTSSLSRSDLSCVLLLAPFAT